MKIFNIRREFHGTNFLFSEFTRKKSIRRSGWYPRLNKWRQFIPQKTRVALFQLWKFRMTFHWWTPLFHRIYFRISINGSWWYLPNKYSTKPILWVPPAVKIRWLIIYNYSSFTTQQLNNSSLLELFSILQLYCDFLWADNHFSRTEERSDNFRWQIAFPKSDEFRNIIRQVSL